MATVDELKILIKAETKQLKKELDQVNRKLGTMNKHAERSTTRLSAGFKRAAIGAGALGLAVGKMGGSVARVGMGFEDLQTSLNTVFGGVEEGEKARQKIIEFAQTTPFQIETATKAFIALKSAGIEPNMEMLQTFADTASVSVDQLGTFEAMIRLVQRSAAGGMGLEELNMISDRGINVTGMLQERLGKSRDELSEFGKTAEGAAEMVKILVEELGEDFGGAMAAKMGNLSTITSNMEIAFRSLADEIFKSGLGDMLKDISLSFTGIANGIADTIRAAREGPTVRDLTATEVTTQKTFKDSRGKNVTRDFTETVFTDDVEEQRKILQSRIEEQKALIAQLGVLEQIADSNRESQRTTNLINSAKERLLMLEEAQDSISEKTIENEKEKETKAQNLIEFQTRFKKLVEDTADVGAQLADEIALIDQIAEDPALIKMFATSAEELQKIRDHLVEMKESEGLTALEEQFGKLAPVINEATNKFTNDFVQSLMDGENAMESFKNLFKDMARQIIASALQMQIIKPIMDAMFTAVGLPVGTKAGGGRVQKGMPTLVGERGAEIFVPNTGGTIMNNMDSKNAMSGGGGITVVQHNNFALGVGATARAEVAKLLPQIQESSKAAVLEAAARGGSFRRGLVGG
jgi:hypothetical protein